MEITNIRTAERVWKHI